MTLAKLHYRPDIDGLRAVAVLAVLMFHFDLQIPGGYIGVDVFFVISGFLITSLLMRDLLVGQLSMLQFWERRARRIIPAMVVVIASTLVAGWFVLQPHDYVRLGSASGVQAIFGANFYYWLKSGYFDGLAMDKPLLNTWSLAVEEQFYLFMPLLMLFLFRRGLMQRGIFVVMLLVTAGSLAISWYSVVYRPDDAFYLPHSRAWELLLGGMIALLPAGMVLPVQSTKAGSLVRELLSLLGLMLILIPLRYYSQATPFPGLAAIPPCLGAGLLIGCNVLGQDAQGQTTLTVVGRVLAWKPLVGVGLISYSLYLIHWPLISLANYSQLEVSLTARLMLAGLSIVLATLSWRWVETPFRRRQLAVSRKAMFATAFFGLMVVLDAGMLVYYQEGFPSRYTDWANYYAEAAKDKTYRIELSLEDVQDDRLVQIGVKDMQAPVSVMVWGDSHAMAVLPAMDHYLRELGLRGVAATHSTVAPALDWYSPNTLVDPGLPAMVYNEAVFDQIRKQNIKHVLLVGRWILYPPGSGGDLAQGLRNTITRLREIDCEPWVMIDVPDPAYNVPRKLSWYSGQSDKNKSYDIGDLIIGPPIGSPADQLNSNLLEALRSTGVAIIDPRPSFMDPKQQIYQVIRDGVVLYWDDNHLSTQGALKMLLPVFESQLELAPTKTSAPVDEAEADLD